MGICQIIQCHLVNIVQVNLVILRFGEVRMEIISSASNTTVFQVCIWILGILLVLTIIVFISDLISDRELVLSLGCTIIILFVALALCIIKITDNRLVYTIRVNDSETVYNLVQKYDVVEYDKKTDTWQVKLKESEEM